MTGHLATDAHVIPWHADVTGVVRSVEICMEDPALVAFWL
jgi:hypothetical protein